MAFIQVQEEKSKIWGVLCTETNRVASFSTGDYNKDITKDWTERCNKEKSFITLTHHPITSKSKWIVFNEKDKKKISPLKDKICKFLSEIIIYAPGQQKDAVELLKKHNFRIPWPPDNNSPYCYVLIEYGNSISAYCNIPSFLKKRKVLSLKEVISKLKNFEDIKITEKQKNSAINFLKEVKAVNADSATKIEENENIYYFMEQEGLVKEYKGRYYLKNI